MNIYKVSHWGRLYESFSPEDLKEFRDRRCITVHNSARKFDLFAKMDLGDYFYLWHVYQGIVLVGRVRTEATTPGIKGAGWFERFYDIIKELDQPRMYIGLNKKHWTPIGSATIAKVKPEEYDLFEETILKEYFDMELSDLVCPVL